MTNPIKPTVGRVVLVKTTNEHGHVEILPGILNRVHSDNVIDVCVMWPGPGATPSTVTSLEYTDDLEGHDHELHGARWGWMEYQKKAELARQEAGKA